jgi:hypothetical protein
VNYNELTRRYFATAPCAGVLAPANREAGTAAAAQRLGRGAAGSRAHGTWVQFDVQLATLPAALSGVELPRQIAAARFLAYGCPHTIAVAAWLAERAAGTGAHPRLPDPVQRLAEHFAVPVEKLGRLLIIEDAWVAAVTAALEC